MGARWFYLGRLNLTAALDRASLGKSWPRLKGGADMSDRSCPCCSLPKGLWEANNGEGYVANGRTYCCRGCAEATLCTCRR